MTNVKCLVALLFVLATVKLSSSLKCFVCSTPNQKCGDPFDSAEHSADICDLEDAVCIKHKMAPVAKYGASTHRACGVEEYCKLNEKDETRCFTCKKDLCNLSTLVLPSLSFLILPVGFTILVNLYN